MKSKYILQLIFFCSFLFAAFPVLSDEFTEEEAIEFAEKQGQRLIKTFSEPDVVKKYQQLDDLFLNYVDLDYISRFVVGKYWRQMTDAQKNHYQDLFRRYATNVYKGFPLNFQNEIFYTINGSYQENDNVVVMANIEYFPRDAQPMNFLVEFRLRKKEGVIKIIDIKVAESSLILSYRNRFYQMIKDADEEMEWFLEDFELSTEAAEKLYALPEEGDELPKER